MYLTKILLSILFVTSSLTFNHKIVDFNGNDLNTIKVIIDESTLFHQNNREISLNSNNVRGYLTSATLQFSGGPSYGNRLTFNSLVNFSNSVRQVKNANLTINYNINIRYVQKNGRATTFNRQVSVTHSNLNSKSSRVSFVVIVPNIKDDRFAYVSHQSSFSVRSASGRLVI
jgi:hypothetical protein